MKNYLIFILAFTISACNSGGGSGGVEYDDNCTLSESEQLFGQGNGTGAIPTELLPHTDNAGLSYLSFGAWGNVYDLVKNNTTVKVPYETVYNTNHDLLEFTTQQKDKMESWKYYADETVADAAFVGPAIMYHLRQPKGYSYSFFEGQDYGTVKVTYGHDISNATVSYTMHNPNNNWEYTTNSANWLFHFSDDRQNIQIDSRNRYELNGDTHTNFYQGYGHRN